MPKKKKIPSSFIFSPGPLALWLAGFSERNGFKNHQEAMREILRERKQRDEEERRAET